MIINLTARNLLDAMDVLDHFQTEVILGRVEGVVYEPHIYNMLSEAKNFLFDRLPPVSNGKDSRSAAPPAEPPTAPAEPPTGGNLTTPAEAVPHDTETQSSAAGGDKYHGVADQGRHEQLAQGVLELVEELFDPSYIFGDDVAEITDQRLVEWAQEHGHSLRLNPGDE